MKKYIYIILTLCCFQSCDKNFNEFNQNPNEPLNINPEYLFSESLLKGAGQFSTAVHTEIWTLMEWTQMLADLNEPNINNFYTYSQDWNNELWKSWYVDALMPVQQVIDITEEQDNKNNLIQMARIWKVFLFHRITDLWGDIPYSDALKGYSEGIISPAYDSQETIYLDLLEELEDAVVSFDTEQEIFSECDLVYAGEIESWTAFANALSCRLALRIADVRPEISQSVFDRMTSSNLLQSAADNFRFPFYSEYLHPFYELEYTGQGMRKPSSFLINTLENDPRLNIFCKPTVYGLSFGVEVYEGVPNLTNLSDMNGIDDNNTSDVGAYFISDELEGQLLTYSEQCFILAEASLKGMYGGDANQLMQEGIAIHMQELGVDQTDIDDYMASVSVASIQEVQKQKWISFLYINGFEAFAEKRRTGYPNFMIENNNYDFPKRLTYPSSEYDLNGTNVPNQGLNDSQTPLWWNNL